MCGLCYHANSRRDGRSHGMNHNTTLLINTKPHIVKFTSIDLIV